MLGVVLRETADLVDSKFRRDLVDLWLRARLVRRMPGDIDLRAPGDKPGEVVIRSPGGVDIRTLGDSSSGEVVIPSPGDVVGRYECVLGMRSRFSGGEKICDA